MVEVFLLIQRGDSLEFNGLRSEATCLILALVSVDWFDDRGRTALEGNGERTGTNGRCQEPIPAETAMAK